SNCLGGAYRLGSVFASDVVSQSADASAHFLRRRKLEFRRHDQQLVHVPFVLLFHRGRHSELEEMTDRPRDQVSVVLEVVLAFLEAAKGLGDVAGDRRLLGTAEGLRQGAAIEPTYGGVERQ